MTEREAHLASWPLPQELTNLVIDQNAHDEVTLRTTSLVCHSWLHPSRRHLFKCVQIPLDESGSGPLISLLKSPHCTFFPYSQTLDVVHRIERVSEVWLNQIKQVLSRFTGIEEISLQLLGDATPEDFVESLGALLRGNKIVQLIMTGVTFSNFESAASFIGSFPALQHLHFTAVTCKSMAPSAPIAPRPPLHWLSINLHQNFEFVSMVLRWILSPEPVPTLQHLSISVLDMPSNEGLLTTLQSCLPAVRDTLKQFELLVIGTDSQFADDLTNGLDFSDFNLEAVNITFHESIRHIIKALRYYSTLPTIQRLQVSHIFDFMAPYDWENLDAVFRPPAFPALQRLRFYGFEGSLDELKAHLPTCHERGLHFELTSLVSEQMQIPL
ncbi:hypothetical protein HGRIS_009216 [Hohenbuehelia grisea]|uniref:F-box domain-containing protein n=1 Tax=Hohenbuehelia grisea TaxID=104357 RepID=A0ABR3J0H0_9AGAR